MNLSEPSRGSLFPRLRSQRSSHRRREGEVPGGAGGAGGRGRVGGGDSRREPVPGATRGPSPPPPLPERATGSARFLHPSMIIIIITNNLSLSLSLFSSFSLLKSEFGVCRSRGCH